MKVLLEIDGKRYGATFQISPDLRPEGAAEKIMQVIGNTVRNHLGVPLVAMPEVKE